MKSLHDIGWAFLLYMVTYLILYVYDERNRRFTSVMIAS